MTEPSRPPGWTLDSLERYLSGKICALEKRINEQDARNLERFAAKEAVTEATQKASDRAIDKVEQTSMEFRKVISEQAVNLMPRTVYEVQHKALADLIAINNGKLAQLEVGLSQLQAVLAGKKEGLGLTGALVLGSFAVLSSLVSVITLIVHVYKPQ